VLDKDDRDLCQPGGARGLDDPMAVNDGAVLSGEDRLANAELFNALARIRANCAASALRTRRSAGRSSSIGTWDTANVGSRSCAASGRNRRSLRAYAAAPGERATLFSV
jgi:hypothetical protein